MYYVTSVKAVIDFNYSRLPSHLFVTYSLHMYVYAMRFATPGTEQYAYNQSTHRIKYIHTLYEEKPQYHNSRRPASLGFLLSISTTTSNSQRPLPDTRIPHQLLTSLSEKKQMIQNDPGYSESAPSQTTGPSGSRPCGYRTTSQTAEWLRRWWRGWRWRLGWWWSMFDLFR